MSMGKPRDRHKEQEWRRRLRDWQRSGLSVSAFCRRWTEPVTVSRTADIVKASGKTGGTTQSSLQWQIDRLVANVLGVASQGD